MAEAAAPSWSISGEYFETCNCAVVCPCLISTKAPLTSAPTEGACEVAFGFALVALGLLVAAGATDMPWAA